MRTADTLFSGEPPGCVLAIIREGFMNDRSKSYKILENRLALSANRSAGLRRRAAAAGTGPSGHMGAAG